MLFTQLFSVLCFSDPKQPHKIKFILKPPEMQLFQNKTTALKTRLSDEQLTAVLY